MMVTMGMEMPMERGKVLQPNRKRKDLSVPPLCPYLFVLRSAVPSSLGMQTTLIPGPLPLRLP